MNEFWLGQRGCPGWGLILEYTCGLTKVCMYVRDVYADFYSETTVMCDNIYRRVCAKVSLWHEYDGEHLSSFVQSHGCEGSTGLEPSRWHHQTMTGRQVSAPVAVTEKKKKKRSQPCVFCSFSHWFTFKLLLINRQLSHWKDICNICSFFHLNTVVGSDFLYPGIFQTKMVLTVHNFLCLVAIWKAWTWFLWIFFCLQSWRQEG